MRIKNSKVWNLLRWVYQGIRAYSIKTLERLSELCFKSYVIDKEFEGLHLQFAISAQCAREWYDDKRTTTPETAFIREHLFKGVLSSSHSGSISVTFSLTRE